MAVPEFLVHATVGWARVFADTKALSVGVTFVHLAGLLLGGGAAVAADRATLRAARKAEPARAEHLAFLGTVHSAAFAGLTMLVVSGLAMFLADLESFWGASAFWIKISLVTLLLANGLLIRQAEGLARTLPARAWTQLRATAIVSLVLWFTTVLVGTILASS